MSTTKQRIKKIGEEKKLKGEVIPTLKYESIRLLRKAIVPVIIAFVASFILCTIFGSFSLAPLSSTVAQIMQSTLTLSIFGAPFMGGYDFLSTDLLNSLAFIPDPFRFYVALVITVRSQLFSAASGINTFLPMSVVPIVFTAMLSTSTLKEEDIYPLLRVDRNKLVLIRSFVNITFYTFVSVLIICLLKQYIISSNTYVQIFSPLIYALTPPLSPSLIISVFIFLFFLQSLAIIINIYYRRAVYLISSILFVELVILLLSVVLPGIFTAGGALQTQIISSSVSSLLMMGYVEVLPQIMQLLIVSTIFSNSGGIMATLSQISRFLFLYQLGGLIHVFSPLFGGVWNLSFFDPQYLLQAIVLEMPDTLIFNGVNAAFAPYMAITLMITEALTKAAYYAWFNFLYVGVIPVALYSLATILFGRKTL